VSVDEVSKKDADAPSSEMPKGRAEERFFMKPITLKERLPNPFLQGLRRNCCSFVI
jgi:hypothetical protein